MMTVHTYVKHPRKTVILAIAMLCVISVLLTTQRITGAEKPSLLGDWQLNRELTEKRRAKLPKAKTSSTGFGRRLSTSVGGVMLPTPGGSGPSAGGATANLPTVLSCEEMKVTHGGPEIEVACPQLLKPRVFKIGKHHGRSVRWSKRTLRERYSSTSRRVTHEFKLEKPNRMGITITVKRGSSRKLTYLLVFDRIQTEARETS